MKLTIELHEYSHDCSDGCCTDYGVITKVNGEEMPFRNTDIKTILDMILSHLGHEVEIIQTYNGEAI